MASTPLDPTSQPSETPARPDRETVENAVGTLLRWAGDDPTREGLHDTPARVVRSYEEFFAGYLEDPVQILARTFSEVDGYDEMIEGAHPCMTTRGVHKPGAAMVTSRMLGAFRSDGSTRREFLAMIGRAGARALTNT